ncbi:MAG: carboxy-S-adenosyl-L-methionine synthase CmoA, partial [Gammaproteobacteria bacterium]
VASVFPDMIQRSVPGYSDVIQGTGLIAGQYATDASNIYDLGCSVGASTFAMSQQIKTKPCKIIAVDNSQDMMNVCKTNLSKRENDIPIELIVSDILDIEITNASVVVMNYTLQFIPVDDRNALLSKICKGIKKGGVLLLSEKLAFDNPFEQQALTELHEAFKRANGYSELEISQKRSALENFLVPETLDQHMDRLYQAGFSQVSPWFRYINFVSLLAWK